MQVALVNYLQKAGDFSIPRLFFYRYLHSSASQTCWRSIYTLYILSSMKRSMTRLFKSNKTQAVRLPKRVAFDESVTEVEIVVVGQSRIISPAGRSWDAWFDGPAGSDDFMAERGQPVDQAREEL